MRCNKRVARSGFPAAPTSEAKQRQYASNLCLFVHLALQKIQISLHPKEPSAGTTSPVACYE